MAITRLVVLCKLVAATVVVAGASIAGLTMVGVGLLFAVGIVLAALGIV